MPFAVTRSRLWRGALIVAHGWSLCTQIGARGCGVEVLPWRTVQLYDLLSALLVTQVGYAGTIDYR